MAPTIASTTAALKAVVNRNAELTATINGLVADAGVNSDEVPTGVIKDVMFQLYSNIFTLNWTPNHPKTPQETAMTAWTSFLGPLRSLEQLGSRGPFLSARMRLFVMKGILLEKHLLRRFPSESTTASAAQLRERGDLLLTLDDELIGCLKRIWASSRGLETFGWVFGEYALPETPDGEEGSPWPQALRDAATVTSLDELPTPRVDNEGENPRLGGPTESESDEGGLPGTATRSFQPFSVAIHWDIDCVYSADSELNTRTPIRAKYCYRLLDNETRLGYIFDSLCSRQVLRRSRQFVLDARRAATRNSLIERNIWARVGLRHSRLPPELIYMIMKYVEVPKMDQPYVHKIDLAQVYRPFPPAVRRCEHCKTLSRKKADQTAKRTCPSQSIVVWNLALRAFMTFHRPAADSNSRIKYSLCRITECQGHHTDESWRITDASQLTQAMEAVVRQRCGDEATLETVGLGPASDLLVTTAEELHKRKYLFGSVKLPRWEEDRRDEIAMLGYGGLVDTMMHNRCTLANFHMDNHPHMNLGMYLGTIQGAQQIGKIAADAVWLYGRAKWQERAVRTALLDGHTRSNR